MGKDDATWLNFGYIVFAAVIAYVGFRAIEMAGLHFSWHDRYDSWFPLVNNVSAICIGAAAAFYVRSSVERRDYHLNVIGEVKRVSWPSIPDTKKMTTVVVVVVAIFSVILSTFDLMWSKVLQWILP